MEIMVGNIVASQPDKLIRFAETANIRKRRLVLHKMLNSLPEDSIIRGFLLDKRGWLLQPLPKLTSIPVADICNILVDDVSQSLSLMSDIKHIVNNKSGVYSITNTADGTTYIGSAINIYKRAKQHYDHTPSEVDTPLYTAAARATPTWNGFTWSWTVETTNYRAEYFTVNTSVTVEELYILQSFTQFEARVFEQALINHFLPRLNGGYVIVFPFMNWEPGMIENTGNPRVTIVAKPVDGDEEPIMFTSISQASRSLNIPRVQVSRYLNLVNHPVHSTAVGLVYLVEPSKPLSQDKPQFNEPTNTIDTVTGIRLEQLAPGKIFAFLPDKVTLFGSWLSPGEAAFELDGKREVRYIKRYINLERPVIVTKNRVPVFFVMSYKEDTSARRGNRTIVRRGDKYILEDTLLKMETLHPTYQSIFDSINKKVASPDYLKRYLDNGKLYLNRYLVRSIK